LVAAKALLDDTKHLIRHRRTTYVSKTT